MDAVTATMLARQAKAVLMHLRQVERLAEAAGVDLDGYASPVGNLLRDCGELVEDVDTWANRCVHRAGRDVARKAYEHTEQWCQRPGGVLPTEHASAPAD